MVDLFMTGAAEEDYWPLIRDYHYSRRLPSAIQHAFAWREGGGLFGDHGRALAACLYSLPTGRMWPQDALELTRLVRAPELDKQLSEFVAWTLRWLKANTNATFVLSYADEEQGHHGGIYQALGFTYVAYRHSKHFDFYDAAGMRVHSRTINNRFGTVKPEVVARADPSLKRVAASPKFLYVKPLHMRLRKLLAEFSWEALPYPKPNAACPKDETAPTVVSAVQPREAAPINPPS